MRTITFVSCSCYNKGMSICRKTNFWSDADHELDSDIACMNKERVQVDTTLNKEAGLIQLSLMFLWQRLFNVSDVGLDILLKFITIFLRYLAKVFSLPLLPFLDQFPRGIAAKNV